MELFPVCRCHSPDELHVPDHADFGDRYALSLVDIPRSKVEKDFQE